MNEATVFPAVLGHEAAFYGLGGTVAQVTVSSVPTLVLAARGTDDVDVLVRWMRSIRADEARVGLFLLEATGRLACGMDVRVTSAVPGMSLRAFGPEGSALSLSELALFSPGRAAA